jgi:hypothetical protein
MEVSVEAYGRWQASDEVYKRCGLAGANDKRIKEFRIVEEKEKEIEPPPVRKRRDRSNDHKYRVTAYVSPMAQSPIRYSLATANAGMALQAVMAMYKVPSTDKLGPYHVQEELSEGVWVSRMVKEAHNFKDVNYIPSTKGPSELELVPVDEEVLTTAEWEEAWEHALHGQPYGYRAVRDSQEVVVSKVGDLFKTEKKAVVPTVNIIRK